MQDQDMRGGADGQDARNMNGNGGEGYGPYASDPNQYNQNGQYGQPGQGQYGQPGAQPGRDNGFAGGPNGGWRPGEPGSSEWWRMNPFKLAEQWLPKKAKRMIRTIYGVVGVVAVLLGLALLIWPGKTLVVFAVALGIYFLVSGIVRVIGAIVENGLPGGWRVLDILVGILLAIGGVVMLKNTVISTAMLTILTTLAVGLGWIMEGIMALVETWHLPSSGWAIFYGIVSILAGIVVLVSPFASMIWLIVFAGCAMVVMGVVAIVRAFRFGRR
ncbi:HdeD family acid-resistance protein [Bifidobacterium sp. ESL0763]|uniref:HdeD family acid-resistance protein n=1 Tax=Bifidobacterium sp. ESL0763 TaxID=2983227 RepID=UPI0023F7431A|nr:HdeD family acid-resistance protein [Bifidobacterium sp. ESL0763]MDF7663579.1 HdeD family acid-resistance protein [Bifidobacterium sp. ESL0763]